jgi:hypothetical protein
MAEKASFDTADDFARIHLTDHDSLKVEKRSYLLTGELAADAVEMVIAECDRRLQAMGFDPSSRASFALWQGFAEVERKSVVAEARASRAEAESAKAKAESAKAKAETRWVTMKHARRERLLMMSPSQAPSVARVDGSRRKTENVFQDAWVVDTATVFEGFTFSDTIDDLCTAAWQRIKPLWSKRPPKKADENTIFHPFVKQIFQEISEAAQASKVKHLKVFHEYDNALENGLQRIDFCFTLPNEARSTHSTCMLPLEVKREDEKATDSEELLRQGLLQAIQRLFQRHDKMGKETTHGIAMATNGTHVIFVRLGLLEDMPDSDEATWLPHPCFITPTMSLFFDTSSTRGLDLPEALPAECPPGLKLWIGLLCHAEQEHSSLFGLPPYSGMPMCTDKYEYVNVLGLGSFATVSLVRAKETGQDYACKFARDDSNDAKIQHEYEMLQHLVEEGIVDGVPKVLDFYRGVWNYPRRENERYALVLADVGVPSDVYTPYSELEADEDRSAVDFLSHFMKHLTDTDQCRRPQLLQMRMEYGERVFTATRAVLQKLHKSGVVHVDVRPPNILIKEHKSADAVAGAGAKALVPGLQIILSDFGEAEKLADSPRRAPMYSDNGFRPYEYVDKSRKEGWRPSSHHDDEALLYSYIAITFGRMGQPPWGTANGRDMTLVKRERCAWLADVLQSHLSTLYPEEGVLRKMLQDLCDRAALQRRLIDEARATQATVATKRTSSVLVKLEMARVKQEQHGAGK